MSNLSQFGGGGVKSVQRGTITVNIAGSATTYSNTATITAVDTSKSVLTLLGAAYPASTNYGPATARVELTNSTTVTAYAGHNSGGVGNYIIGYQVVEFY